MVACGINNPTTGNIILLFVPHPFRMFFHLLAAEHARRPAQPRDECNTAGCSCGYSILLEQDIRMVRILVKYVGLYVGSKQAPNGLRVN